MKQPNGVRMMLTTRKRVRAPFTLPPAIGTTIIEEIIAPPGERYISQFISAPSSSPPPSPSRKRCRVPSLPSSGPPSPPPPSPSPVLAVPTPDVLPPYKRLKRSPDATTEAIIPEAIILDVTAEAMIKAIINRNHFRSVARLARIESAKQEIEALCARAEAIKEQVAILQDSLRTARVRVSNLDI
ncbi:hypothetical protein Tco_0113369 [Tanacetum coccineum]